MSETYNQQEEADRLCALFDGINQAKFARDFSVPGGKSFLNQHIKGKRSIGLESAIAYAIGLNVSLREVSQKAADTLEGAIQKGLVGGPKMDLQIEQVRLLLDRAKDRDAAFLLATAALTKYLIEE